MPDEQTFNREPELLENVHTVARETLWLIKRLLRQLVELPEQARKGIDITMLAETRRRLEAQLQHCEVLFHS